MLFYTIFVYHSGIISIDNKIYIGFTVKQAIKKFRIDNGLEHKKITFSTVYGG